MLMLLLFFGDAGAGGRCGETALDWAVWKGSAPLAALLLAAGALATPASATAHGTGSSSEVVGAEDPRGYSALHRAALAGDARALKASRRGQTFRPLALRVRFARARALFNSLPCACGRLRVRACVRAMPR